MSYSTEVLADSPLAYWRLGDASGTTLTDSSGNGHNGTYSSITLGTTGLLAGDSDTAATFNGSSSNGLVTGASWMNTGTATSLTVEAIIKPTGVSGTHNIADRDFQSAARVFQFRLNGNKLEFITIGGTVGIVTATSITSLSAGTAYHVAATFDGSNIRLYINGTLDRTVVASGSLNTTGLSDLSVGATYGGGGVLTSFFGGVIDEVAYYNSVLSGTRLAAHYAAMTATPITVSGTAFAAPATFLDGAMPISVPGSAFASPATMVSGAALTAISVAGDPFASAATMLDGFVQGVPIPGEAWHSSAVMLGGGAIKQVGTDTSNALNGRRRGGSATVELTVPVAPAPAGTTRGPKVDKAVPLPLPTLVNGRPT